ncbi:MAG: hypothetical protein D6705_19025, partial [Deltaproteobacteria bacterium]
MCRIASFAGEKPEATGRLERRDHRACAMLPSLALVTFLAGLRWLEPPVPFEPTDVRYVRARYAETFVHRDLEGRRPRAATVARGTILVARGFVPPSEGHVRCRGRGAYAIWPFGLVCADHVRPTETPPPATTSSIDPLPYRYALVRADDTPAFEGEDAVRSGTPFRHLEKGMTLAVVGLREIDGVRYVEDVHGHLVAREAVAYLGGGSAFRGVFVGHLSPPKIAEWALLRRKHVVLRAAPDGTSKIVTKTRDRAAVRIVAEDPSGRMRIRLPDGTEGWVDRGKVARLSLPAALPEQVAERMAALGGPDRLRWIYVDLGRQIAVAYVGERPMFATVVSSGAANPTPRGLYPVWGSVATIDMDNQSYEDDAYMVQQVPWSVFFQGHNALHGAYWHDGFGRRRSHGCVNLPPSVALWIHRFVGPALPTGWTGYFPLPDRAPVVYVEDTSRPPRARFVQDRPTGPPDPEEERRKAEEAAARRSAG